MLEPGQHHAVNAWRRETFAPGTPSDATITERRLWAVNPQDYEWRSQYLHEIPDWLAGYFGNRYEKLLSGRDGRRRANTFLRKTIGGNVLPRLRKVAARYKLAADALDLPFGKSLERLPSLDRPDLKNWLVRYLAGFPSHFMTSPISLWAALTMPQSCAAVRWSLTAIYAHVP